MTGITKQSLATRLKLEKERAAILTRLRHVDNILARISGSKADSAEPEGSKTMRERDCREAQ